MVERKVKPKSRSSTKGAANTSPATTTIVKTSKYFPSPVEEETDSEDDTSAAPGFTGNPEKPHHDEGDDSEDDEDDWEEVEGK